MRNIKIAVICLLAMALLTGVVGAAGKPVKITDPADGAMVSGVYVVTGTGKGAAVEVSIDGGAWQAATGTSNWTFNWDTTAESDGAHTVAAQYSDGSSTDTHNVTVDNSGGGSGPRQPNVGEVLINEFVAAPSVTQTTEWVELFNTTAEDLDISGMWLDDLDGAGSAPVQIPANTTIVAGGFYVQTFGTYFNNGGDDVRLLSIDQATVHDAYTYASATADMSWCRDTDGGAWRVIECDPTQGTTNDPPLPPGTWTPGTLEIHLLDVGQGESQLIIGPTGKTLLIGVMEPHYQVNTGASFVASEIRRITGGEYIDYVMPSHWHLDHMGYATNGGIWSLLEEQGITAGKLIDRDGGVWVDANQDGICDQATEIEWHNIGTLSGTATNWVCWATDPNSIGGQIRELAQLGSTTQIDLGLPEGVVVEVVQVDANGVMMADGVTPVAGDHSADPLPPSENDYSITIWLRWGKFDFVAGGDSDGEYATSEFSYTYNDVESVVAPRINQNVEVIWVNHHGSGHSTSPTYANTLDPQVALYGTADNTYGHPDQRVLDLLYANGAQQYFYALGDPTRNYYNSIIVGDEVVVQVTNNGDNFTVNGDPYASADPAPPSGPRKPNVGEVLINEYLPAPSAWPYEFVELYNTTGEELDISGMYIDDIVGGGSAAQQIPASTTIAAGGYYVHTMSGFLNNGGDDVTLLGDDGATIHDQHSYTSVPADQTNCRQPDGGSWVADCAPSEGATNGGGAPQAPQVGDVVINEFLPNNSSPEQPTEFVELYNTTGQTLDISGMYVDDISGGGGSPIQIPADTYLAAGAYYVVEMTTYLNNTGDDVQLLGSDGVTVHDSYTYTTTQTNMSYCRVPDGGTWAVSLCNPTKGSAN